MTQFFVASHGMSVDVPVAVCGSLAAGLMLNGKIVRGVFFFGSTWVGGLLGGWDL
jgi:hypothetical protein